MNRDFQLKLQAYLDGELTAADAREVEALLARDVDAQLLAAELRNTAGALAVFEAELRLPETRDFFWSKIKREIERQDRTREVIPTSVSVWRRFMLPAVAFAALVLAGLIGLKSFNQAETDHSAAVETFLMDSGAMTYRDEAEGMTVVWLSYPAENGFADRE